MGLWIEPSPTVLQYSKGETLAVSGWKPLTGVMGGGVDPFCWTMGRMKIKFGKVWWTDRKEFTFEMIKRDQGMITERSRTKQQGWRMTHAAICWWKQRAGLHSSYLEKTCRYQEHEVGESYRMSFSHAAREDQPCLREARHLQPLFLSENSILFPGVRTLKDVGMWCVS